MQDVFSAVADPTRRILLERIRTTGPLSISALTDGLPMSRQAVSKHLGILHSAGLVEKKAEGRERVVSLCAAPLRELDDWLAPYSAAWDARLDRLKRHVDGGSDA